MSDFTDLIASVRDTSKERLKSPLIGSFMIAFLIFNWRAFSVLILSNKSVEFRIEHIESNYCNFSAILWPIFIALLYVIIIPRLSVEIDALMKENTKRRKDQSKDLKLHDIEIKKVVAKGEREIQDIKAGTKDIEDLQKRVLDLQDKVSKLNTENENLSTVNNSIVDRYEGQIDQYKKNEESLMIRYDDIENARLEDNQNNESIISRLSNNISELLAVQKDYEDKIDLIESKSKISMGLFRDLNTEQIKQELLDTSLINNYDDFINLLQQSKKYGISILEYDIPIKILKEYDKLGLFKQFVDRYAPEFLYEDFTPFAKELAAFYIKRGHLQKRDPYNDVCDEKEYHHLFLTEKGQHHFNSLSLN